MKAAAIIQARMTSSRLPGKTLMSLANRPMLQLVIERLQRSATLSDIIVATSAEEADDPIVDLCASLAIPVARGSRDDVLARFAGALALTEADMIVRVTADCPLIDSALIDKALAVFGDERPDHLSCGSDGGYPRGINAEIIARTALELAAREAAEPFEREHVTPFLYTRPDRFRLIKMEAPQELRRPDYRITVDEPADMAMVEALIDGVGGDPLAISLYDVVAFLDAHPEVAAINGGVHQKHFTETGQ
ncbi:MAG: glycosyltransferase family protein [Oceanicaulis sp.]|uniref:cytidylyltransferase domain-containing protein n=1 Tax=Glycocaulis sp. TaxID=1969725 RepID=UPI0025BE57A0|nr:glycosyltransferase family protein [Glycocaulis sp.]MCC5982034.1 glycosyltransferase family protein [Oceanicaulis sp.]MCH8520444.1 glycosyltransferase family protein [Glycocaulis sp.]